MASVEDVSQDPGEYRTPNPHQSTPETIEEIPIPETEGTAAVVEEDRATGGIGPVSEEEQGSAAADQSQAVESQDDIVADPVTESSPGTSSPPQKKPRIGRAPEVHAYYEEDNHPDSAVRVLVRYVEVQNYDATGWGGMAKTVKEYDEEKILFCKEDIDTLLVFAGLYSAILSAFIIESYQRLQPDSGDQMVQLFQAFFAQNYTISSGFLNATNPYPTLPPFEAPAWAVRVNVLWFSSLIISLASASFGMLVKQWLREYLRMPYTSPQERLRARQFRRKALDHWRVFEIAAALPLMLELSVLLFFVGLCYFTLAVHWSIGRTTIPLVGGWAFLFIAATVAPAFSPRCPYKTTLLDSAMLRVRRLTLTFSRFSLHVYYAILPVLRFRLSIVDSIKRRVTGLTFEACTVIWDMITRVYQYLKPSNLLTEIRARAQIPEQPLRQLKLHMQEEGDILKAGVDDIELLKDIIDIVPGDGILGTLFDVFRRHNPTLHQVVDFVFHIMSHRIGEWNGGLRRVGILSNQARDAFLAILAPTIDTYFLASTAASSPPDSDILRQAAETYVCLVFAGNVPLSPYQRRVYARIVEHAKINSTTPSEADQVEKVPPLIHYDSLKKYAESTLHGVEEFLTGDGELKEVSRNCLDIFLTPWVSSSNFDIHKSPISPKLCRRLVEQLMQAYFLAKRSNSEAQILRRSDLQFKKSLFCAILVTYTRVLFPWTNNSRSSYPSLSVVLSIRTASTQNMPKMTHLPTFLSKGMMQFPPHPFDSPFHTKLPNSSNYGAFVLDLVQLLRPGIRGVSVDIVLYQFTFWSDEERSHFLNAIADICYSVKPDGACLLPRHIDFCALLSMILSLLSIPAAHSHTNRLSKIWGIASTAIENRWSALCERQWRPQAPRVRAGENLGMAMAVVKFTQYAGRKGRTQRLQGRSFKSAVRGIMSLQALVAAP